MFNFMKKDKEIKRLQALVKIQKDTVIKSMKIIEELADDNIKLQAEIQKLQAVISGEDLIFPNTDERGLGDGDTPSDLSPLDM